MIELIGYESKEKMNHVCVVCADGWIFCGVVRRDAYGIIRLVDSAVVRSRSDIGYIVKHKVTRELDGIGEVTIADEIGEVTIAKDKVLFTIPCEW